MIKFIQDVLTETHSYYEQIVAIMPKIIFALALCILIAFIIKNIRKKVTAYLRNKAEDTLLIDFSDNLFSTLSTIIIILLFLYIVGLGGIASSIMGAAGLSAFVIGFALKDIGENFLAGVIMAFDRPFRLGDVVKTGNVEGTITEMSLRDTHIKTFDGKDVYVPNGQIIKIPLYNYTIDGFSRTSFSVGIDYNSDVEKARNIISDTLSSIPGILQEEKPHSSHVKELAASSIVIQVMFWINTYNKQFSGSELKSNAQSQIVEAFKKHGININYDIIEVRQ